MSPGGVQKSLFLVTLLPLRAGAAVAVEEQDGENLIEKAQFIQRKSCL